MAKKKSAPKSVSKTSKDKIDGWLVIVGFALLLIVPILLVSQSLNFTEQVLSNSSYTFVLVGYIAVITAIFIYYIGKNSKKIKWSN